MRAMLRALKNAARRVLPDSVLAPIVAIRARRLSHRLNREWDVNSLSERLFRQFGTRVLSGPFAGLVLPAEVVCEHVGPYLFGVYEHELHDTLASLTTRRFSQIVNVGAKFGYYSAGLAKLLGAPVTAFDVDPWARRMTRATADASGVGRLVAVESACTRDYLSRLPPESLVVIDCDGCEMQLLAPPLPDGLRGATIIVEVHEMFESGAGHTLRGWLEHTHTVREIPTSDSPAAPPVDLTGFSEKDRELATKELRPHQSWLVCEPRSERR
jgi:hypothetical protein